MTQRENGFDVTSVGQCSSPWPRNWVKVETKFHLKWNSFEFGVSRVEFRVSSFLA